ncbi:MAG: amidase family protein [Alphaproteobacteria bacterium]|nr:amidase family protein [Alphaproteobacteria bacterium]
MTNKDLCFLPATELATRIADRDISPVDAVEAVLAAIERWEPRINSFITVTAEEARSAARAAEAAVMAGDSLGPLHGVPFSVKDLLNTAGARTTFGSHAFADNVPSDDCVAVARLKQAGAILIGKTTTPEFGHKPLTEAPLFGKTRNPWNLECTSGGSSGGAGAAVAAGLGPLAVGTDGGGSVRIPAACCGIVGMKQTLGVVPHDQSPDSFGLMSYIGPMARTVGDAALMLSVMAGPDASDVHSIGRTLGDLAAAGRAAGDLKGARIGWRMLLGNEHIDPETAEIFQQALGVFEALGATLEAREDFFENTLPIWGPLTFSIWASRFGDIENKLGDRMSDTLRRWMAEGRQAGAVDVQDAMAVRTSVFRSVQAWFDDVDLVVMPTLARPAISTDHDLFEPIEVDGQAAGGPRDAWYPYTHPFNLTGHPAITVPCGWTKQGLPAGLQIVGPWLGDALVLQTAAMFEAAQPWSDKYQAKLGC